jgi:hypothetical protein
VAVIAISVKGVRMRVKDVFSVFPRKLASGKVVSYYRCYDNNDNRRALSKAASPNGNPFRPNYSKDFLKIKNILEEHRARIQATQKELWLFRKIKRLVGEAGNEEPEKYTIFYRKSGRFFPKMCGTKNSRYAAKNIRSTLLLVSTYFSSLNCPNY